MRAGGPFELQYPATAVGVGQSFFSIKRYRGGGFVSMLMRPDGAPAQPTLHPSAESAADHVQRELDELGVLADSAAERDGLIQWIRRLAVEKPGRL